jgi:hypothetical protein
MEQSTTILNEANAEFNIVVLCSIKPHIYDDDDILLLLELIVDRIHDAPHSGRTR